MIKIKSLTLSFFFGIFFVEISQENFEKKIVVEILKSVYLYIY